MAMLNRDITVTIGTKRIAARVPADAGKGGTAKPTLRMVFEIEKNTNRDPNTAKLGIWNLSKDSRSAFEEQAGIPTIVEAGYVDQTQELFRGELNFASSQRQGPDWITEFQAGDGSVNYRSKRIRESLGTGTLLQDVLTKLSEALGVDVNNALQKIQEGNYRGALTTFTKGVSLNGKVSDLLDKYMTAAGFEWWIDNGALNVARPGETLPEDAIRLSFSTGLIGSPEAGEKGVVKARALLNPALVPGKQVEIDSAQVSAFFKIEKALFFGDTWGQDWYVDIEAKPV